jgi:hypothetical protein
MSRRRKRGVEIARYGCAVVVVGVVGAVVDAGRSRGSFNFEMVASGCIKEHRVQGYNLLFSYCHGESRRKIKSPHDVTDDLMQRDTNDKLASPQV